MLRTIDTLPQNDMRVQVKRMTLFGFYFTEDATFSNGLFVSVVTHETFAPEEIDGWELL